MKRSVVSAVAVFLVVVLVIAGVVVVAAVATDGADAVRVEGHAASVKSVNSELRGLRENTRIGARIGETEGSVDSSQGAQYLTFVVRGAVARRILESKGGRVTADDRIAALDAARSAWGNNWKAFTPEFRDAYVERSLPFFALGRVLGVDSADVAESDELAAAIQRAGRRFEVWVNPVYGDYRPHAVIVVPVVAANQSG
jgi:hypothetical protein